MSLLFTNYYLRKEYVSLIYYLRKEYDSLIYYLRKEYVTLIYVSPSLIYAKNTCACLGLCNFSRLHPFMKYDHPQFLD